MSGPKEAPAQRASTLQFHLLASNSHVGIVIDLARTYTGEEVREIVGQAIRAMQGLHADKTDGGKT